MFLSLPITMWFSLMGVLRSCSLANYQSHFSRRHYADGFMKSKTDTTTCAAIACLMEIPLHTNIMAYHELILYWKPIKHNSKALCSMSKRSANHTGSFARAGHRATNNYETQMKQTSSDRAPRIWPQGSVEATLNWPLNANLAEGRSATCYLRSITFTSFQAPVFICLGAIGRKKKKRAVIFFVARMWAHVMNAESLAQSLFLNHCALVCVCVCARG